MKQTATGFKQALILFLSILFFGLNSSAQDFSLFERRSLVQGGDTLPYRILLPQNYDSSVQYPVVFFLHGAGERGRDNERQMIMGAKLFLSPEVRRDYPAIVVYPQCSLQDYWANALREHDSKGKRTFHFLPEGEATHSMVLLQELVQLIIRKYPVKRNQIYVGGLSMGGMGTFELVRRQPNLFAAAFAICGGANPATAKVIRKTSWWVFHGAKDDVVPPQASQVMVEALKTAGAQVKFTLYPNANHNSWDPAFAEKDLLRWLFAQKRGK